MRRSANGEDIYSRLSSYKPRDSQAYNYNHDDPVSERSKVNENRKVLINIVNGLRVMKIEARDGFKALPRRKQKEIINLRRREVGDILGEGSFSFKKREYFRRKVYERISKIYKLFMKK